MVLPPEYVVDVAYKDLREDPFSPWTISAFHDGLQRISPDSAPCRTHCYVCLDLQGSLYNGIIKRSGYPAHHVLYRNLVLSSKIGCPICRILQCAIVAFCRNLDIDVIYLSWPDVFGNREDSPLCVEAFYSPGVTSDNPRRIQLYHEQDSPIGLPIGRAGTVIQDSDSERCRSLYKTWLSDCLNNHDACQRRLGPLPTRTIFVGSGNSPPHLYLSGGERKPYVALSHSWGGVVPFRTLSSNFEDLKVRISEDELPKTFTDAMRITRQLGFEFLWIDSLCIIQDNAADWQRESERMGSYYSNAILTIAADRAANSRCGCFAPRESNTYTPFRIDGHGYGIPGSILARETPRRHANLHDPGHTFRPDDPTGWLCERAWVYQEWTLSRRILHFTRHEVVWECDTTEECECRAGGGPGTRPQNYLRPREENDGPLDPYARWRGMVHELTQRDLTYHTDRLPALAGLAALMSEETNDVYVCGMWAKDPKSLLWCSLPSGRMKRHDSYYAPSWSWASVISEVKFGEIECEDPGDHADYANIVEMNWEPATLNRFGPAKNGFMKIEGEVLSAKYEGSDEYGMGRLVTDGALRLLPFNIDAFSNDTLPNSRRTLETTEVQPGDKVVIFIVVQVWNAHDEERQWFGGLVLKPTLEDPIIYQRVGIVDSRETKWKVLPRGNVKTVTIV